MSARFETTPEGHSEMGADFAALERLVNERFTDAIVAGEQDERYAYFVLGNRLEAAHHLGVFCVADSVEPLRQRKTEQLRLSVPIAKPDMVMPISALGEDDAHYFYLTYVARRGGLKTLMMTPEVLAKRFNGRTKPPVPNLTNKLETYGVVRMRERDLSTDLDD